MRCVTDTNVMVSGLLWLGNPGRLLEAAAEGGVTLYTSPALVTELRSTLNYNRLIPRIERSGLTLDELVTRYLNVAIVIEPVVVQRIVPADPDDDHVIACALAARADLIVSGDTGLLELGEYQGIRIVNPAAALTLIEQK